MERRIIPKKKWSCQLTLWKRANERLSFSFFPILWAIQKIEKKPTIGKEKRRQRAFIDSFLSSSSHARTKEKEKGVWKKKRIMNRSLSYIFLKTFLLPFHHVCPQELIKERKSSCNGQTLTMERSRKRQGKCVLRSYERSSISSFSFL